MPAQDIVSFVHARTAEDSYLIERLPRTDPLGFRISADWGAKRLIIESYLDAKGKGAPETLSDYDRGMVDGLYIAMERVANAYSDHPDFNQSWVV